ncbi:unnamed protein product [Amoebophrya sp. A120]|nr:unnamed protein product [Amoebophrya sp. A120]|eukprot:GSA120T00003872001.1
MFQPGPLLSFTGPWQLGSGAVVAHPSDHQAQQHGSATQQPQQRSASSSANKAGQVKKQSNLMQPRDWKRETISNSPSRDDDAVDSTVVVAPTEQILKPKKPILQATQQYHKTSNKSVGSRSVLNSKSGSTAGHVASTPAAQRKSNKVATEQQKLEEEHFIVSSEQKELHQMHQTNKGSWNTRPAPEGARVVEVERQSSAYESSFSRPNFLVQNLHQSGGSVSVRPFATGAASTFASQHGTTNSGSVSVQFHPPERPAHRYTLSSASAWRPTLTTASYVNVTAVPVSPPAGGGAGGGTGTSSASSATFNSALRSTPPVVQNWLMQPPFFAQRQTSSGFQQIGAEGSKAASTCAPVVHVISGTSTAPHRQQSSPQVVGLFPANEQRKHVLAPATRPGAGAGAQHTIAVAARPLPPEESAVIVNQPVPGAPNHASTSSSSTAKITSTTTTATTRASTLPRGRSPDLAGKNQQVQRVSSASHAKALSVSPNKVFTLEGQLNQNSILMRDYRDEEDRDAATGRRASTSQGGAGGLSRRNKDFVPPHLGPPAQRTSAQSNRRADSVSVDASLRASANGRTTYLSATSVEAEEVEPLMIDQHAASSSASRRGASQEEEEAEEQDSSETSLAQELQQKIQLMQKRINEQSGEIRQLKHDLKQKDQSVVKAEKKELETKRHLQEARKEIAQCRIDMTKQKEEIMSLQAELDAKKKQAEQQSLKTRQEQVGKLQATKEARELQKKVDLLEAREKNLISVTSVQTVALSSKMSTDAGNHGQELLMTTGSEEEYSSDQNASGMSGSATAGVHANMSVVSGIHETPKPVSPRKSVSSTDPRTVVSLRDLSEIKALKKPPEAVRLLFEACCLYLHIEPNKRFDSNSKQWVVDYWEPSRKHILSDSHFMQKLRKANPGNEILQQIQLLWNNHPTVLTEEKVANCCRAAKPLFKFIEGVAFGDASVMNSIAVDHSLGLLGCSPAKVLNFEGGGAGTNGVGASAGAVGASA